MVGGGQKRVLPWRNQEKTLAKAGASSSRGSPHGDATKRPGAMRLARTGGLRTLRRQTEGRYPGTQLDALYLIAALSKLREPISYICLGCVGDLGTAWVLT